MNSKTIENIMKYVIAATFVMPLILISSKFVFPFIVPKVIYFRSLTILLLVGYVLLLVANWTYYKIRITPIMLGVLLFFISIAISTFTGVDWYRSFWDNHERMLGLFTVIHFIIFYIAAVSVVHKEIEWKWLFRAFLFTGSLVMLIGILQRFVNPELLLNKGASRVSATLGNAIYYSGFGLFLLTLGLWLVQKEQEKAWRIFAGIGAVLGFLGIFIGGTRGTVLGLGAGIGLATALYAIFLRDYPRVRKTCMGLIVLGVVSLGILFAFRQTAVVKNIPALGRLLNTSITEGSAGTRIMAWEVAVDGWKDFPVFGWGPNNFYYAFNKHYRPEFLEHGIGETWFDNAHNVIMNTLATQGIIGVFAYLFLFGVTGYTIWKGYKQKQLDIHTAVIFSAFLVAHFIHNIFVFENPTSYLYFFFILAFLDWKGRTEKRPASPQTFVSWPLIGTIFAIGFLVLYLTNIRPAQANMQSLESLRALYAGSPKVLDVYEDAKSLGSPHIDDIRSDFARTFINVLPQLSQQSQNETLLQNIFNTAYEDIQKNMALKPMDIRINLLHAQLAQIGYQSSKNISYMEDAEKSLQSALELSPERQQVIYALSSVELQLEHRDEAIRLLEFAIDLDPKIGESWTRLIATYDFLGEREKAQEIAREVQAQDDVFLDSNGQQIVDQFAATMATPTVEFVE